MPATAQTVIHRCIGAHGGSVYTDQACTSMGATPALKPATDTAIDTRTPPILCAADRPALRQAIIDAFAQRDPNRLAGLMLWNGYGRASASADIRTLANLVQQPLLDIDRDNDPDSAPATPAFDDPFATDMPATPAPINTQLVLHTAGIGGSGVPHERRFTVVRRAGCLWLRGID